ncbi:tyrosine-type recombinase/integrase [Actinophytocola algeriensis]|uniref:Integrase n=1 Tax=Actinophytocola algeriensis TaxID=1768010 RepID=A0A7W7QFH0_9PSEU|nr:site-specific integrase [Actinophytocola algeriensis]MBB4912651.1 integrase [Actinophytocola algeriensis]MBE1472015.1 integrase [Actinophytocola algeriensis]
MSEEDVPSFGVIRMRGGRYERHGLPLEAASELQRYEHLVIRVARALYMRQHPQRRRSPRGFTTSVILRLTAVQEGSVIPVLRRDEFLTQDALISPLYDYFDQARLAINQALGELESNNNLGGSFPVECIKDFAAFGRSLREDERIEFSNDGTNPVRFSHNTRRRLQEIAQLDLIDVETAIQGQVTGLRSDPRQFDFVVSPTGRKLLGSYQNAEVWDDLRAFQGFAERAPMVSLSVVAAQSLDGSIRSISNVLNVEPALPAEWADRIKYLADLEDGWLDGSGLAPSSVALDKTEEILLACVDENVPRPGIYPTESGGSLLEWPEVWKEVELEILNNGDVLARVISKIDDADRRERYQVSDLALPDWHTLTRLADALVANSSGEYRGWGDVVLFAACTAARIGEVSGCRVKDIDTDEWTWTVRRQTTPSPGGLADKGTKGKRARTVPLIEEVQELVQQRMADVDRDPEARLFVGPRGGRITTAVLRDATRWDDVVGKLGYEHLRRHDLRHTGLTWMADAGVPVHHLRKIAGHGSLTTTQQYLHPDRQSVTNAGDLLSRHLRAPRRANLRAVQ